MGIVISTWQFEKAPSLATVVDEIRARYDGPVKSEMESYEWSLDDDDDASEAKLMEMMVGTSERHEYHVARLKTAEGEVELQDLPPRATITARFYTHHRPLWDAADEAMRAVGGTLVEPTPEQKARSRKQVYLGMGTYAGLAIVLTVLFFTNTVGVWGLLGILLGFFIVRFIVRLILAYRRARGLFPETFKD